MAKQSKLTKKELESLTSLINKQNQIKIALADIEVRKSYVIKAIEQSSEELTVMQKSLEEKYGDGQIDLKTGKITDK